jgi:hypothetical protein
MTLVKEAQWVIEQALMVDEKIRNAFEGYY